MEHRSASLILLMVDDDEDDCLLAKAAFDGAGLAGEVRFLGNGEQLVECLRNGGDYSDPARAPRIDLILLGLNMPRMDGRKALRIIKSDSRLKYILVAILTTSREQRDVDFCMDLGACRFITKPVEFEEWIKTLIELTSLC